MKFTEAKYEIMIITIMLLQVNKDTKIKYFIIYFIEENI